MATGAGRRRGGGEGGEPSAGGTPPGEPGTLTRLIEEVVRGTPDDAVRTAWTAGVRPGAVVGRYELLREIGRGGFGVVFEARDRELGRPVAFKALRVGGEAARERRLLAEAEVAARLSHPNIVTLLDVGRAEQGVFLVQEFLTGAPLSRRLADGRLPVREAVRIGLEIARGLAHAHAHGVVHRDLTPGNVQLCDDGQVKLLDLGMAAALGRRKLEGGTPAYMAPEQVSGDPEDERTDVYALGALLYRMLTGTGPVEPGQAGRPRSGARGLEVPETPALAALVEAMLARAPADRPRDAGAVLAALQEIAEGLPRSASGPSRVRVRPPPRARWAAAGALGGALLALAVGLPVALRVAGARGPRPLAMAASSTQTPCSWRLVLRSDFDGSEPLRMRQGKVAGQERRQADGVPVWHMGSDWNQLAVPLGGVAPDVVAVQVQVRAPAAREAYAAAGMVVFTDPVGPLDHTTSDLAHGLGINLIEEKGQAPYFHWGLPQGEHTNRIDYRAGLPAPFTDRWVTLRFEASRSGRWARVLLDGRLLLVDPGAADLTGGHVLLTAQGDTYGHADALWKHLMVFEGSPECR